MARTKNEEQTERRREQIVEGAMACFVEKGFHQSSMAEICKRVGMSPGTVYHYFKSKDDIIVHIAEQEVRRSEELALALGEGGSLEEEFCKAIDEILASSLSEKGVQMYLEVLCEAGRNKRVGQLILKAERIGLRAICKRLKKECMKVDGVSADVLGHYLGGQLELLEIYKGYEPSTKECAQMALLCKRSIRMMLKDWS